MRIEESEVPNSEIADLMLLGMIRELRLGCIALQKVKELIMMMFQRIIDIIINERKINKEKKKMSGN